MMALPFLQPLFERFAPVTIAMSDQIVDASLIAAHANATPKTRRKRGKRRGPDDWKDEPAKLPIGPGSGSSNPPTPRQPLAKPLKTYENDLSISFGSLSNLRLPKKRPARWLVFGSAFIYVL
jgi:hypothetical protein